MKEILMIPVILFITLIVGVVYFGGLAIAAAWDATRWARK